MEPTKDYNLILGLRIREIREAYDMTREEFSENCDISTSLLADMENGKKSFSTEIISQISTATNVSMDYFLYGLDSDFES